MDLRRGLLQQPAFQLLLPVASGRGLEGRADHAMADILNAPNQIAILLTEQGSGIGQRRDIFADHWRIVVVLLELHPLGFLWQRAQLPEQGLQIAKVTLHRHQAIPHSFMSPGSTTRRQSSARDQMKETSLLWTAWFTADASSRKADQPGGFDTPPVWRHEPGILTKDAVSGLTSRRLCQCQRNGTAAAVALSLFPRL